MGIYDAQINSATSIDPADISFSKLNYQYSNGRATCTFKGQNKVYGFCFSVQTKLGNIEETVWYQLMEQLIKDSGEQWLLDALIQWETDRNYRRLSATAIKKQALESHSNHLFDNPAWIDFIPFNRSYRPEVLAQAHTIEVINECCGVPGEVTQEQIDDAYMGNISCPHCGRWSAFTITKKGAAAL